MKILVAEKIEIKCYWAVWQIVGVLRFFLYLVHLFLDLGHEVKLNLVKLKAIQRHQICPPDKEYNLQKMHFYHRESLAHDDNCHIMESRIG
jgi:hypothetical protein